MLIFKRLVDTISIVFIRAESGQLRGSDQRCNSKQLGSRIRQARERLGMTQEELAERSNKDQRAISEYENGKRRLSALDLPTFAKVLDVPMIYFFEGEITGHDVEAALLEHFNKLPTLQAKESAIELVRIFSESLATHYSP